MAYFKKAVSQATAEYDLLASKNPLFVEWTRDATGLQNSYWTAGMSWLVGYVCCYLLLSVILGVGVQMGGGAARRTVDDKVRLPAAV